MKLCDFGLEALLPPTLRLRTPGFVAPEQILRQEYSNEPDIYTLGVVAYLLLIGMLPFYQAEN